MPGSTSALSQRAFISRQIFDRSNGLPVREEDRAAFALVADLGPPRSHGLNGDKAQLGHAGTSGADGLHDQGQPLIAHLLSCADQPGILRASQLPAFIAEEGLLYLQQLYSDVLPTHEAKETIDDGQDGVDGSWGVAGGHPQN